MTKKDYTKIAATLKADMVDTKGKPYSELTDWEKGAYDQWHTTCIAIADTLQADNPAFNRIKFLHACKPGI